MNQGSSWGWKAGRLRQENHFGGGADRTWCCHEQGCRAPSGSSPHPPTYASPNAASLQGAPSRAPGRVSGGAGGPRPPISSATSELCDLGRFQPHCLPFRMVTGVQLSWKLKDEHTKLFFKSFCPSSTYILLTPPPGCRLGLQTHKAAWPGLLPSPDTSQGPPHPSLTVAPNPSPLQPAGKKEEGQEKEIESFELDKVLRSRVVQPSPSSDERPEDHKRGEKMC